MSQFTMMLLLVAVLSLLLNSVHGTIDEAIVDAANTSRAFDVFYDDSSGNGMLKVEYDILMSPEEYDAMQDVEEDGTRKRRSAGTQRHRWTDNTVYYEFVTQFTHKQRNEFNMALYTWSQNTCLRFIEDRFAENRIQVIDDNRGCYSRIAMWGGPQPLGLSPGCRDRIVIMHEIGHALGLYHEQSRPDRDQYVSIMRDNVQPSMLYNFKKQTWDTILNMGVPYDYRSIMHYGKTSFGIAGRTTIRTQDPHFQDVIGSARMLSFTDIKSINIMYNCKRHTTGCTLNDSDCPGTGFVGKDCTCWCEGDPNDSDEAETVRPCSNPTPRPTTRRPTTRRPVTSRPVTSRPVTRRPVTPRPTPRPTACQDDHRSCSYWAAHGECGSNPDYMLVNCKRSCNRCGGGGGGGRVTCEDNHHACAEWLRIGYCNRRYQDIVRPRCKKSCGICTSGGSANSGRGGGGGGGGGGRGGSATTTARRRNCADRNTLCPQWARSGECQRNPAYMLTSCRFSCNTCLNAASPATGHSARRRRCPDRHVNCNYWRRIGECTRNPNYMRMWCKASCGFPC